MIMEKSSSKFQYFVPKSQMYNMKIYEIYANFTPFESCEKT